jgi:hypothetical protein
MKKLLFAVALLIIGMTGTWAQSIKGPESISYFQAPSQGVKFAMCDVFMSFDQALADVKKEEQKDKNSAMGAKFGALGSAVANTANQAIDIASATSQAIDALKDKEGRFDRWKLIPDYIIATPEIDKPIIVEIFVMNEQNPNRLSAPTGPLQPDKEGNYDVPFYVNCRYKVTTPRGEVITEKNFGVLQGEKKWSHYTQPPQTGGLGSVTVTEGLSTEDEVGINVAFNKVREDVFGQFGFGEFSAPIKLGVIKEIKESKKLIEPTLAVFENKRGLLLNKDEKAKVQEFVDIIEAGLPNCTEKSRWVAYHNLSVCYAWLEQPEKAKEAYKKYGEEIAETIDEMAKWNLLMQGKLPKEDRKGLVIGMKDFKKFDNYRDIANFVEFYPAGVVKYEQLFTTINRDLKRFVDFYAVNDIMCQLFEIDYPFQFLPLNDFAGQPKSMKGQIAKEGIEPVEYRVKFDKNRRIKELEADQVALLDDGSKEKIVTRELQPIFNEDNGRYIMMSTPNARNVFAGGNDTHRGTLRQIEEPLGDMTKGVAKNITKGTGFFSDKITHEVVQLKVDLQGKIFFVGSSSYFKANAIFKDILTNNGIEPKRTDTRSEFSTEANINENGLFEKWSWNGDVSTDFGSSWSQVGGKVQNISATRMLRDITVLESDEHGNPTKIQYAFEMKGKVSVSQKMNIKEWFIQSYAQGGVPKAKVSSDTFDLGSTQTWDCTFVYDDQGNWTEMKIGPYTATRTFKY